MSEYTTRDDAKTDYITAACIRRQVCALDDEFHNVPSRRIGMPIGYHDVAVKTADLERSLAIYVDGIQAREGIKMRIIITGGRNRDAYEDIDKAFDDFIDTDGWLIPAACTIIDGACPTGVDYNAGRYATEYGFKHETYPADWDTYGKSAGPRRNEQMAAAGADICLAFPSAGKSAGTWDMIRRAANHGIKTIIIPEETK